MHLMLLSTHARPKYPAELLAPQEHRATVLKRRLVEMDNRAFRMRQVIDLMHGDEVASVFECAQNRKFLVS